jgi:N-methylhydantoinase B
LRPEAIVRTGGGGGWGDPLERDPALVCADVREELVSAAAARARYGVVLTDALVVEETATKKLRDRLRSQHKVGGAKAKRRRRGGT